MTKKKNIITKTVYIFLVVFLIIFLGSSKKTDLEKKQNEELADINTHLEDVVNDPNTSDNHKQQIQQKINDLMRKLHDNFITHGDFKRTNFIVSGGEPYVTDLDSMRVHMPGILFKHRQKKDVNRLKRMFTQTSKSAH